jgi:alpha-D-xyloside xylohydrolase
VKAIRMEVLMTRTRRLMPLLLVLAATAGLAAQSGNQPPPLLSDLVDISRDFADYTNGYFLADHLASFDPATASGALVWQRNQRSPRIAFSNMISVLRPFSGVTFPENEYAVDPELAFSLEFVTPRTVRVRMKTGPEIRPDAPSLMLAGAVPHDSSWKMTRVDGGYRYTGAAGSVTVLQKPWRLEFRDAQGKLLTKTNHAADLPLTLVPALPFSFIRRSSDYSRSIAASFYLSAGEQLFGTGESFTRLDKRGQRVVLWSNDANGVETERMYKPIPFFMSSRGYGMFVHSSTPMTFDMGASFHAANNLLVGDDTLDLFVFLGDPKQVLGEYTALTGRPSMPPLWSFGLWMSRITYFSEDQVRDVAAKLRANRIPDDVIHLDTGWFETDWRCDYQFSKTRFKDPAKMIADLKNDGFRISLWQLPYFVPKNTLFPEIVKRGLYVKDVKGSLPYEDAVLDFSNPEAVKWYQETIGTLIRMGVGAIKVDFGEAAPLAGVYASGRTGFYEHNLYPLRYNKVVADITKQVSGENIIWARSAWAGSQRYPLHWGGDSGNLDQSMLSQLRGGLSIGLSGFTFWSHDIGGFSQKPPEDLYRRWLPFGMLSSHSRAHGAPPREPWEYGAAFQDVYRKGVELKYKLMPYVYAQARESAERGLPMVRALFIEFPDDPGSWHIEDEYMFGSDLLVAPLFEAGSTGRSVYLPPGHWIDYQSGKAYGAGWHTIEAGAVPIVMLVRYAAVLPHIALAQSTKDMDWSKLELVVYAETAPSATGLVCLPSDNMLHKVELTLRGKKYVPGVSSLTAKTALAVRRFDAPVK